MSTLEITLRKENFHIKDQLDSLEETIGAKNQIIRMQERRLEELLKRIYGRKSEKLDPDQLKFDQIILEADQQLPKNQEEAHPNVVEKVVREYIRRSHPGRQPLPEHLERVEHYLDIPEEDKVTAKGKVRPLIGIDITEKLDYSPCTLVVNRHIRPKYGADEDIKGIGVKQHPAPEGPIDKCMAESGLLANVITEKYEHHTPFYHQELKFSRQAMAGWMFGCSQVLKPLYNHMHKEILSADVVLNDDTPVEMLSSGNGKTRTTRLWSTLGGDTAASLMSFTATLSTIKN